MNGENRSGPIRDQSRLDRCKSNFQSALIPLCQMPSKIVLKFEPLLWLRAQNTMTECAIDDTVIENCRIINVQKEPANVQ